MGFLLGHRPPFGDDPATAIAARYQKNLDLTVTEITRTETKGCILVDSPSRSQLFGNFTEPRERRTFFLIN
uniref:Uncharacterized protein n=1 Tax=Agrobacterium tumefaciens TaxID=358 RepID=K7WN60_AGRTU|nr:Hypothetical protein [Agrobacterium radiobacter]